MFMSRANVSWESDLSKIFASSVNQQSLEEAAELIVDVSLDDQEYHGVFISAINQGIRAANDGDKRVIDCINGSGDRANIFQQASELLSDFKEIYLREYDRSKE